ncbi:amidase [Pararhizobium sp. A13]|uniref:amidase n=1 Tax=Pararhizobium sp. A13 TaxID=3133975 RepID=UPI00311B342A
MTGFVHKFDHDSTAIALEVGAGRLTARSVAEDFIARTLMKEPDIQAFAAFNHELVVEQADRIDRSPEKGLLAGVPIGVKDIFDTVDWTTEFNSPIYRNNRPSRDANAVALLRQAGAVVMGKTATAEFAFMHTGPTRNPHDLSRTPGSSSAGSAAGLAAGLFAGALGTQTAGSLIKPASYCGLYAYKPSQNLVSLEGVKPLAPSFDTVGWYGASARDLSLIARVLIQGLPKYVAPNQRLKLGFCKTPYWGLADPDVRQAIEATAFSLAVRGHDVDELVLPSAFEAVAHDHQIINDCEGARALHKEQAASAKSMSPQLAEMFERASTTSWENEVTTRNRLGLLVSVLHATIEPYDAVIAPSCAHVAPVGLAATGTSDFIRLWTAFGLPQANIPLMRRDGELPIGLQVIGSAFSDVKLLHCVEILSAILNTGSRSALPE